MGFRAFHDTLKPPLPGRCHALLLSLVLCAVQQKCERTVLCDSLRDLDGAAASANVFEAYAPNGTKRFKKGGNSTVRLELRGSYP